jgi:group I intron endonuclease
MNMPKSYVYKLTNKVNGKVYVGKSNNPSERLIRHFSTAKTGSDQNHKYQLIHKAIAKYGKENFVFKILEECMSEQIAYEQEMAWIEKLKSNDRKFGYNQNEGGLGGHTPNEDVRQQISASLTGRINSLPGLLKKLHKLFSFVPEYKDIYKSENEIRKEKERLQIISDLGVQKIEKLNDDVKRLVLKLNDFDCFRKTDIADALGIELKTVRYVLQRYKNGVPTEEQKHINRSNAHKGKKFSDEHKQNISAANVGKTMPQISRKKISEANVGENNGMFGKTHSEGARQKMSNSQSSRIRSPLTEETKSKISAALKGKPRELPILQEIKNEVVIRYNSGNYTKQQIADELGLKYNTIVKIIRTNKTA